MTLIEKAKGFYALALSDPGQACQTFLADDFCLENPLPEIVPFGGTYQGADGFVRYLTEIAGAIDMGPLDMEEWTEGNGVVAVRGHEESLVRATGRTYRMRFVHWLSFDEYGKIRVMREYNDTAEMEKAFKNEN